MCIRDRARDRFRSTPAQGEGLPVPRGPRGLCGLRPPPPPGPLGPAVRAVPLVSGPPPEFLDPGAGAKRRSAMGPSSFSPAAPLHSTSTRSGRAPSTILS
eukprot:1341618-Pyramimonas_sp.AAC.1